VSEKDFKIYLNDIVRIIVYLETKSGRIKNFVVKLEFYYNNEWHEVERYDCFHGHVHKDIFDRKGDKKRVIIYPLLDKTLGLNMAINDFKDHHDHILWRFLND
jgi:hypothetical protein